ncbi:MAG TPA: nitrogen fixation protein NifQ [Polyangiaceae bacterium]|nr:nitrogen fixation protein NifQ [Polyangiaceae bacterium]
MESADVYGWLMGESPTAVCDRFDAHVVASVLSLAMVESTKERRSVVVSVGLESAALTDLVGEMFPHAHDLFARLATPDPLLLAEDEVCLRDLLVRCATRGSTLEVRLASIVARRSQRPNHLWQDLGLRNRQELSWLMAQHFEWLASRNTRDMKWKKFLYRTICRDGSFPICTAPSCAECSDFDHCFGDESGESLLAIGRRKAERTGRAGESR